MQESGQKWPKTIGLAEYSEHDVGAEQASDLYNTPV